MEHIEEMPSNNAQKQYEKHSQKKIHKTKAWEIDFCVSLPNVKSDKTEAFIGEK